MNKVSAVVITKNEEENIADCIKCISWCDEVLIIDDFSTDKTFAVAQKYGAKVVRRKLNNNFAQQRNFALKEAKNDWILYVDADEEVSDYLQGVICEILKSPSHDGYLITRQNYFHNLPLYYGEWGRAELVRLGKKNAGIWKRAVHEYWDINNVKKLDGILRHNSSQSINDLVSKFSVYSKLHALENLKEKKEVSMLKVITFPVGKFVNNYILKQGYKDGVPGFIMAIMMSFHSFLSWSQLWLHKR
jgi:glycosyltransferase involved in cell wall biosynthesis